MRGIYQSPRKRFLHQANVLENRASVLYHVKKERFRIEHASVDLPPQIRIGRFERGALRPGGDTPMRLADEDKNVVKKLLDALLTKKHFQALTR